MVRTIPVIMLIVLLSAIVYASPSGSMKYNCSMAEISPDYPVKVKNQCRSSR